MTRHYYISEWHNGEFICEICEIKPTKKWNFPCRCEDGMLAELEIVCKGCHDEFSLCNCPRGKND